MKTGSFVFLDIDGTIYTKKGGIPDSTREALDALKRNGHHPVVCTGRTRSIIPPFITDLDFDGIIAGVGSYGEWKGEPKFETILPEEEIEMLIKDFLRFGFAPYAEGPSYLYYAPEIPLDHEGILQKIFAVEDLSVLKPYSGGERIEASKVSALFMDGADEKGFRKVLPEKFLGVNHYNYLLETFPVNTTKGDGVQKLLSALGKEDAETFAYGDSFNDLEMLETVKHGVCMGNGDPKLLARIPLHAKPINEDGLYLSLKEFGLI